MDFFKKVHADFCSTVESGWSEIKTLAEKSAYWEAGLTGAEELTVRRRSAFTALFTSHTKTIKGPSG